MTGLLQQALKRLETLSPDEQDAIAAQIMETLGEEQAWDRSFKAGPERLKRMAEEALAEHHRGETMPLNEFLGGRKDE
jgi:DnaJ-domain-containing protein 1